ncbi:MAG: response regulator (CheY-like receiver domain and HTH DNA-binding domain containing protein) [Solidesulfovibrio magneticus str. Maddingley MBC34]|uniref:Response regulator (CheY-like receiver domain and HTH DNA-binding domain containing protein) n=1 Tax=Solidesulfovibrio magneticus str. Maddingley MBC34 TaxID=1206767 RepID=K6H828_9BACT|nr:MAG: response regulator (CheY-like receiver domain and HTH DNA-binding domain containing protein) [Solidesulfovibrio magneticus str. Maddingley MBC34]
MHAQRGPRIFLADDHPAVREGLTLRLLQEGFVVCGEAENRATLLETIDASQADIALVDLTLCGENGLDLIDELRLRAIPVLVYSMHEDAETVRMALDRGARGYVAKRETSVELVAGVRRVLAGQRYLSPRVAAALAACPQPPAAQAGALSDRERQTLGLLSRGEGNAEIAAALGVSVRTVESYYSRILTKLDLDGMKALRKYAIGRRMPD